MQATIIRMVEEYGKDNLEVILGVSDSEAAGLTAETLTIGDPTYFGALSGVSLGLEVYHLFELKNRIAEAVYELHCKLYDRILDKEGIIEAVSRAREVNRGN